MSVPGQTVADAPVERTASGVSWGAIIAGAAASAALALILLVLGTGLGMSAVSPWPGHGIGAAAFGASTIVWLVLTQIIAAAAGGYLAGRLRIKWATVHTDEVYFRDTAHGFLAWSLAALVSASLIVSFAGSIAVAGAGVAAATSTVAGGVDKLEARDTGSGAETGRVTGTGAAAANGQRDEGAGRAAQEASQRYLVHSLFRAAPSATDTATRADAADDADAGLIFANSIHAQALPPQDQQYLAQVVARHTGLSQDDAAKRVGDTFKIAHDAVMNAEQSAREAADKARKATAYSALWMFVSLLCGAFCASLAATFGGKQRDRVIHVAAAS